MEANKQSLEPWIVHIDGVFDLKDIQSISCLGTSKIWSLLWLKKCTWNVEWCVWIGFYGCQSIGIHCRSYRSAGGVRPVVYHLMTSSSVMFSVFVSMHDVIFTSYLQSDPSLIHHTQSWSDALFHASFSYLFSSSVHTHYLFFVIHFPFLSFFVALMVRSME